MAEMIKNASKGAGKTVLKGLIILPFAMLAYDYFQTQDIRGTMK